jgi:branched-chain amino acid transport system substrate-binding protein
MSLAGSMLIFKEALEKAGAADRRKVAAAIRAMDTTDGPAKYFPGGRVKFDDAGRRVGADVVVVQWQNGVPVTVYPTDAAVAKPIWPKR